MTMEAGKATTMPDMPLDQAPTRLTGAVQYIIAKEDYLLARDDANDTITVVPRANHIHCEVTGKILEYRHLIKLQNKERWEVGALSIYLGPRGCVETIPAGMQAD